MKLLQEESPKKFVPFELTLLVETEAEARLLYHVFNRGNLKDAIFVEDYGNPYKELPIVQDIGDELTRGFIKKHLTEPLR